MRLVRHGGSTSADDRSALCAMNVPQAFRLRSLLAALDGANGTPDPDALECWLQTFRPTESELRPFVRFGRDKYRRNLVCRRKHYEVLVLCWSPGQHSPIHDHHGSHCAVAVLSGEATEVRFVRTADERLRAHSIQTLPTGAVTASIDDDLHVVANWAPSHCDLVTLHVYSPPLTHMRVYGDDLVEPVPVKNLVRLDSPRVPDHSRPMFTEFARGVCEA